VGLLTGTPLQVIQYSSQLQREFIIIIAVVIIVVVVVAAAFGFRSSGMLGGMRC
jgi:hypothetical protein